ncbi:MAG: hypothetical protein ACPHL6_12990 [Rubripirellula sp.]
MDQHSIFGADTAARQPIKGGVVRMIDRDGPVFGYLASQQGLKKKRLWGSWLIT